MLPLYLFLLFLGEGGAQCPPPDAVAPCQCREGALACSGPLPALSTLLRQGACGARLKSFHLNRAVNISELPDNLFFKVRLQSISIWESHQLQQLGLLLGQELCLQELSVRSCQLQGDQGGLTRLRSLRHLDLSQNRLQRPPRNLPNSLQSLFLRDNRISTLRPGDLSVLTSLIQLDLSENQLVSIDRGCLPGPQLIFLTLNNNQVAEVSEGAFEESGGNLRRVDLSGNLLSSLPKGVWAPVWGDLHKLDLAGNPIQCNLLEDWLRNPEEALRPPENVYGLNCPAILIHREEEPSLSYN